MGRMSKVEWEKSNRGRLRKRDVGLPLHYGVDDEQQGPQAGPERAKLDVHPSDLQQIFADLALTAANGMSDVMNAPRELADRCDQEDHESHANYPVKPFH